MSSSDSGILAVPQPVPDVSFAARARVIAGIIKPWLRRGYGFPTAMALARCVLVRYPDHVSERPLSMWTALAARRRRSERQNTSSGRVLLGSELLGSFRC